MYSIWIFETTLFIKLTSNDYDECLVTSWKTDFVATKIKSKLSCIKRNNLTFLKEVSAWIILNGTQMS